MKKKFLTLLLCCPLFLVGCGSSNDSSSSDGAQEETKEETKKNEKAKVGETVTTDNAKITVNSAETLDQLDDFYSTADKLEEGQKYGLIDITIENLTDEPMNISSVMNFELKDGDGRKQKYELPVGANGQMDGEIAPGDKLTGQLTYIVNENGELTLNVKTDVVNGETIQFQVR